MSVEERLRQVLAAEADAQPVDLQRLHAGSLERRAATRPRQRGAALIVAACLVLVAGAALGGSLLLVGVAPGPADRAGTTEQEHVDTIFSCEHQREHRFEDGRPADGDDAFVPDLGDGAAAMARSVGAPRYVLEVHGDTATLRLGNADGTLSSRSELVRGDDGWVPVRALVCWGDGSPLVEGPGAGDADRLAVRGATAVGEDSPLRARDVGPGARLLDRRGYYDASGLLHTRTIWAAPCGQKLCVRAGVRDSYVAADVAPGTPPSDLTSLFLPPDDMVGIDPPYAFVVVRDADAVTWRDVEGRTHAAARVGDDWFVLAPYADLADVVVQPRGGEPRGWTLDEMR
jgi:hypothetical protein